MAVDEDGPETGRARWRRLRVAGLSLALIVSLIVISLLSRDVLRQLDRLATSRSDNIQWSLSQLEVEAAGVEAALVQASHARGDAEVLDDIRRRFDIFYSRVETVALGVVYQIARDDPAFSGSLDLVQEFLDRTVVLIDGPDEALDDAIPALLREAPVVRNETRMMALRGIVLFAEASDQRRAQVAATLYRVAMVTFALVLVLVFLTIGLARLYRISQARARQIQQAGERMAAIVGTSLDAVLVVDREGRLLEFNAAAEGIFGYSGQEVIGQRMSDLMFPDELLDANRDGFRHDPKSGEINVVGSGRIQMTARRRRGEVFPVEATISSVGRGAGRIFILYLRDITERLADEQALREARDEALVGARAKAEFLAVMSHEMRTPLNGLIGTIELLEATHLDARQKRYLDAMTVSGRMLLHHVNDVLDISRLDARKLQIFHSDFEMGAMLENIVEAHSAVAAVRGNTLTLSRAAKAGLVVCGDERRVWQVMLNLVANAVKFTRGGEITIELDTVGRVGDATIVELRVVDTGIGIAEADQERIFDDFVTLDSSYGRRSEGTGLGLGIARRTVQAMGGEIGVESVEGQGSLFWVRLPMELPVGEVAKAPARDLWISNEFPARDILIVEDNQINRFILREMLEGMGQRVSEAHDGEEGIAVAAATGFDLILMDISMPRMDGIEATRAIRAGQGLSRGARIVALTAHAMPAEIETFRAAGMDGCVIKPVTRQQLAQLFLARAGQGFRVEPAVAVLDTAVIEEFAERVPERLGREFIARFIAEGQATIAALADIFAAEGPDAVAVSVHRLAGAAATFGARALHAALGRIETRCKFGDAGDLSCEIAGLEELWAQTQAALVAWQARAAAQQERAETRAG